MKIGLAVVLALGSGILAPVALAQPFDSTALFQAGAWGVEHTYDVEAQTSWCSADTINESGQWLSVVAYDHGAAAVVIGDPEWNLSARSVRFRVDIDQSRWDIDGAGEASAVSVSLDGNADAGAFLEDLMDSSAVAVYNGADRRLATFSLQGARSALLALIECWDRIDIREPTGAADPFTLASDPF